MLIQAKPNGEEEPDLEDEIVPDDDEEEAPIVVQQHLGKADTLDTRPKDILSLALTKLTFLKHPEVHGYPAPPTIPPQGDPSLGHRKPPRIATVGLRKSYLAKCMNSTLGRFVLFCVTAVCVNCSIVGLVNWNAPGYRKTGLSFYLGGLALFVLLVTFTVPLAAEKSGMNALETGWKPYLVMYRLAFVMTIPSAVFQSWGYGTKTAFGLSAGPAGVLKLQNVQNNYWDYFELADGFVALNLSKGVVETLAAEEHGVEKHRRFSRFRDAELRINTEPYSDVPEPTETPGRLATYRIAPIFKRWAPCVSRYRISSNCLMANPVQAWAVSKSMSFCSGYKSVGCKPPKPWLRPVYKCSKVNPLTNELGVHGTEHVLPIEGLCGHVGLPPPDGAIDELGALMLYDAWPKIALPKVSSLWLDVAPDPCIADIVGCTASWWNWYLAGLICQFITNLFIIIPAYFDCKVDSKIRKARKYADEQDAKARKNKMAASGKTSKK